VLLTHPVGAGTGNVTPLMVKIYLEKGEEYAAKRRLNAHNQFLQTGAELGWPGLLCLVGFFAWFVLRTRSGSEGYPLLFAGLMCFHFLFESFLEAQAGIVFFSFWALVFLQRKVD
jgi:O-antigen ligase